MNRHVYKRPTFAVDDLPRCFTQETAARLDAIIKSLLRFRAECVIGIHPDLTQVPHMWAWCHLYHQSSIVYDEGVNHRINIVRRE